MPVRPNVEIVSVDIEQRGRLFLESRAAAGATVRFYLNDTLVAPGVADAQGKVSFSIDKGMRPGDYKARLDDVDPVSGAVKSRAEVAFNIPEPAPEDGTPPSAQGGAIPEGSPDHGAPIVSVPDIGTMVVSRGDSLWQISRRIYGIGYRYTYIYNANQKQIRNPDLIYPGQVFVLPRMENGTGNGEDSVPSVVQ